MCKVNKTKEQDDGSCSRKARGGSDGHNWRMSSNLTVKKENNINNKPRVFAQIAATQYKK